MEQWQKEAWTGGPWFLLHYGYFCMITRMHCGRQTVWWRQCGSLGNVVLGGKMDPGIHVDVAFTCRTFLNIVADKVLHGACIS